MATLIVRGVVMELQSEQQSGLPWAARPARELLRVAWPIALSLLSFSLISVVDTLFIGRLGPAALAGVAVGEVVSFTLITFGMGALTGVKTIVAQATGAGDRRHGRVVAAGLWLAIGTGVLAFVVAVPIAWWLPAWASSPEAGVHGAEYLLYRSLGAAPFLVAAALKEARQAVGDSQSPLRATLTAHALNAVLNPVLMFGLGQGVAGAAQASVVAACLEAAMLLRLQRGDGLTFRTGWAEFRAVLALGTPVGLQMMLEVAAFAAMTAIFLTFGDLDVAAHQIVFRVFLVAVLPAQALGEAGAVLIGQAFGARRHGLLGRVLRDATVVAFGYATIVSAVALLAGSWLLRAFTPNESVIATGLPMLHLALVMTLLHSFNVTLRGVLRGVGDVNFPSALAVGLAWLSPLATWLALPLGGGIATGYVVFSFEIGLGAGVLAIRSVYRLTAPTVARAT